MNNNNIDSLTIEDEPQSPDKMVVNFDFSAWESFRETLSLEEREALRRSSSLLESFERSGTSENDNPAHNEIAEAGAGDVSGNKKEDDNPSKNNELSRSLLLMLTDEERRDIEVWRQRLLKRLVYDQDYTPTELEGEEMNYIIEYLVLKKPKENDNSHRGHHLDESENQITEKATSSIFFAQPNEHKSVLLKRGPVLLNGEERELMIFTNGFVFSHIELDTLIRILLDLDGNKSSDSEGRRVAAKDDITSEQLRQRFKDIDTNQGGSLDRVEIHEFFQSMGMPLGGIALDGIMDKLDSDSDGAVSWNEFKSMMHEMKTRRQQKTDEPTLPSSNSNSNNSNNNNGPSPWMKSFGKKLKRALSKMPTASKLDVAFQMKDITKIEDLSVCHSEKTRIFANADWAHLTMAVHITGMKVPLLVTCAKPGHVDAWMEAFRTCIANGSSTQIMEGDSSPPGLIVGGEKKAMRPSVAKWMGSSVDWG